MSGDHEHVRRHVERRLVGLLAVTWAYLAVMYKEFFVRDWLKRWPIVYMVSHMAIMPLIDLFATGGSSDGRCRRAIPIRLYLTNWPPKSLHSPIAVPSTSLARRTSSGR